MSQSCVTCTSQLGRLCGVRTAAKGHQPATHSNSHGKLCQRGDIVVDAAEDTVRCLQTARGQGSTREEAALQTHMLLKVGPILLGPQPRHTWDPPSQLTRC